MIPRAWRANTVGEFFGKGLPDKLRDQQLEVSIDGERVELFTIDMESLEYSGDLVTPPIKVKAGPRRVSVVFLFGCGWAAPYY